MGNIDVDKNAPDILFDMLTKSQIHKQNDDMSDDDQEHKNVEVYIVVTHVGVFINHDDKIKYVSTGKKDHLVEDMEKNIETLCEAIHGSLFMGCVIYNKVY